MAEKYREFSSPAYGRGVRVKNKMIILDRAKTLRRQQTNAEQKLWYHLRGNRFHHLKFKRQKPVGPYIVDFVCMQFLIIIEIDGGQHCEQLAYDNRRTKFLQKRGYQVLRFWNHEIMQQIDSVLVAVDQVVRRALSPNPSPASGRGELQTAIPYRRKKQHTINLTLASEEIPTTIPSPACGRGAGERAGQ